MVAPSSSAGECCLSTNVQLVCNDSVLTALVTSDQQTQSTDNQLTRYWLQV